MTWVVSSPTIFGYAVAVSDTRVTLSDGSYVDCLQKVYEVAPRVVAGFAGNVHNAFRLLDDLHDFLGDLPEGCGWEPEYIAEEWPARARAVWMGLNVTDEHLGGVDVQVLLAHPTEDNGIPNYARNYVITFRSPTFEAEVHGGARFVSIGSGADTYREALEELSNTRPNPFFQAEVGNPGGYGRALATSAYMMLLEKPDATVGPLLQCYLVWRHQTELRNLKVEHPGGGWVATELQEGQVVPLCTSWDELIKRLSNEPSDALLKARC